MDVFRRIRLEALRTEPAAYASRAEDWEIMPDEERRRRLTDNPVFVAFDDDEPVGITGLIRQQSSKMAHRATIGRIPGGFLHDDKEIDEIMMARRLRD